MYIFLDEAGDLGFDFTKKATSKFFVITLLVSTQASSLKTINMAVAKTIKKINHKKQHSCISELKGSRSPIQAKKYFLNKTMQDNWCLYSIVVDKQKFRMPTYIRHSSHLYNYIVDCLFNRLVFSNTQPAIFVTVDKCKTEVQIEEFNRRIEETIRTKLPLCSLTIKHKQSHDDKLLQAVDMFCFGVFSKYEHEDLSWYSCFEDRMYIEDAL